MVTWLLNHRKATKIEESYEPHFYVAAQKKTITTLLKTLSSLPQVQSVRLCRAKLTLGSDKQSLVIEVAPKKLNAFQNLASMIDAWGKYHTYHLFNVDLRFSTRYLFERGVFCHAKVSWDGTRFTTDDNQWAVDYEPLDVVIVPFTIHQDTNIRGSAFSKPIVSITVGREHIEAENETDTILSAVKRVKEIDPDIITTINGDSLLFPLLYHRAALCGLSDQINLGREKHTAHLQPVRQATSYFSYGRIVYRPAFYTLLGRLHLDLGQSFLYGESGLHGILDVARCSNIPMQLLSRLGPGTAISQIEMNTALHNGYLIPWKKTAPENWKDAEELLRADRGGLVLEPLVGLHEDVVELDYASLYPHIMLQYNISPETLLCTCCPDSSLRVPQLGYHICMKQTGLLPQVLKPILSRRFCFKARAKNREYDYTVYQELQQAWKWVLVVCFGYTGYRNARYGRIECHESITAYSRDILLTALHIAERSGYAVLHGIIDSLWVKGSPGCLKPSRLARAISTKTKIRMDVNGIYRWIVFLPSKITGAGALTRYYGMFNDGVLKIRGIELRQHTTPRILKNLQHDILTVFKPAQNAAEFYGLIPEAITVLKTYIQRFSQGNIACDDCVFTTRVSRDVTKYKVNTFTKSAVLQLRDIGRRIEPGQSVQYVVTHASSKKYKLRVCISEKLDDTIRVDHDFYRRQMLRCAESLLTPFGYTFKTLEKICTH